MASSSAKNAQEQLPEDYSCGFCLEELKDMVDPRRLACSHTFCLPCLEGVYVPNPDKPPPFKCPVCGFVHDHLDARSLPKVNLGSPTKKIQIHCSLCGGSSIEYCTSCGKNLCQDHHQMHGLFLGDIHKTIDIEQYTKNASVYDSMLCPTHPPHELALICRGCETRFCLNCDMESNCTVSRANHTLIKFEKYVELQRQILITAIDKLREKKAELYQLDEDVCTQLEQATMDMEEAEYNRSAGYAANYSQALVFWKDNLEDICQTGHVLYAHTLNIPDLDQIKAKLVLIEQTLSQKYRRCSLTSCDLLPEGHIEDLNWIQKVIIQPLPSDIKLLTSIDKQGVPFYSAAWTPDHRLLATGPLSVFLFDVSGENGGCVVKTGWIRCGISIALHELGVVVMDYKNEGTASTLTPTLYSHNLKEKKTLTSFRCQPNYRVMPQLTIDRSSSQIVALDKLHLELAYFNMLGEQTKVASLMRTKSPSAVHALPDGCILLSDIERGTVSKYIFDSPTKFTLMWTCDGFEAPSGISSDSDYIYVIELEGRLHILSVLGERLVTTRLKTNRRVKSIGYHDIAVADNQMAVVNESAIHIYALGPLKPAEQSLLNTTICSDAAKDSANNSGSSKSPGSGSDSDSGAMFHLEL